MTFTVSRNSANNTRPFLRYGMPRGYPEVNTDSAIGTAKIVEPPLPIEKRKASKKLPVWTDGRLPFGAQATRRGEMYLRNSLTNTNKQFAMWDLVRILLMNALTYLVDSDLKRAIKRHDRTIKNLMRARRAKTFPSIKWEKTVFRMLFGQIHRIDLNGGDANDNRNRYNAFGSQFTYCESICGLHLAKTPNL